MLVDLKGVKFLVKQSCVILEEQNFFLEAYRCLFAKIYGLDIFDSFLKITDISSRNCKNLNQVKNESLNYNLAKEALKEINSDVNIQMLLIYLNDDLVGVGRFKKIDEKVVSIPDLIVMGLTSEMEREIWQKAVSFGEMYFTKQGYEKMYLEIPFQEGPLLIRANELGFCEDVSDIKDDSKTYLLNKVLERK